MEFHIIDELFGNVFQPQHLPVWRLEYTQLGQQFNIHKNRNKEANQLNPNPCAGGIDGRNVLTTSNDDDNYNRQDVIVVFIVAVDSFSSIYTTYTWIWIQFIRCLVSIPVNVSSICIRQSIQLHTYIYSQWKDTNEM